jgi:alkylhydroperoxidase family enzyme
VTEEQLHDLARFEESAAFSDVEKLVIRLAVALSRTPADVPDDLFAALRARFDDAQLVELSAAIAWENFRSRYNRLFDVGAQGFSEGAYCPMPERHQG